MKIALANLQKEVPVRAVTIKKLIRKILKNEKPKANGWINICFVDNAGIKKFNAKFHKTRSSTDVLAFNLSDEKDKDLIQADILISAQKAKQQASCFRTTPDHELSLYAAHGLLHILGFNDQTAAQAKRMRKKESQYVNR
jgi:probable rRNA maturation factor